MDFFAMAELQHMQVFHSDGHTWGLSGNKETAFPLNGCSEPVLLPFVDLGIPLHFHTAVSIFPSTPEHIL